MSGEGLCPSARALRREIGPETLARIAAGEVEPSDELKELIGSAGMLESVPAQGSSRAGGPARLPREGAEALRSAFAPADMAPEPDGGTDPIEESLELVTRVLGLDPADARHADLPELVVRAFEIKYCAGYTDRLRDEQKQRRALHERGD